MALLPSERSRVLAVLGPTNTGKTHFAVERMLAHRSGLIGFPLRLLAREIYDRILVQKGAAAVALITGEERIQPQGARYFVATVEAMPEGLETSFLAVDEIQLCADPERGHIFTDRLLRARGRDETMFLGADTIRPLLKQLVPEAEVITRPRFSTLSYTPPAKVTRLPRRSAVVAFTAQDVYALAELVRRQRGGAAVVLGALSPRTRNAQVALYQAGEVDYLIATDAIGMGLNMDLGHVALASLTKFDGHERRPLHATEIGQIAGRAGRHMQDGTFGTTHDMGGLDPRTIEAVEGHEFPALRQLRWRSAALDLGTLGGLLESLDAPPPAPCLLRTGGALDHVSLRVLARRPAVRERAATPAGVRLLWSVCQIPDFRKTLTEAHLHLLDTVFGHLADHGRLPTDWVADQVARLERTVGDIDTLIARLAHIRTWTYVAHHADWLRDAAHWQERTRAVEDALSDALHDRLTQRFIDRRTQALLKGLQDGAPMAAVEDDGAILVEGHAVGRVDGLRYVLEPGTADAEQRALGAAARRVLVPELRRRAQLLIGAPDESFALAERGVVTWRWAETAPGAAVGRLLPGATALAPRLEPLLADSLSGEARAAVRQRLALWLDAHLAALTRPLRRLQAAGLEGPGRGLAFLLVEGLGNVNTAAARAVVNALGAADRARLTRLGVRFGVRHVYLPAMLRPRAIELRVRLWSVHRRVPELAAADPGRPAYAAPDLPPGCAEAVGAEAFDTVWLRVDVVERLAARLRALARDGPFALPPELGALTGLSAADLAAVVEALGYGSGDAERYVRSRPRPPRRAARRVEARGGASPFAALRGIRLSG
ncbi:MAG: helicase [Geminicoccaceae bacterium]|nr:helicase [Geminicoccaceae bacterium]